MSANLDEVLGIDPTGPKYIEAKRLGDERYARAITKSCIRGNCALWIDPLDGKVFAAFGLAGCDCEDEPA